MKRGNSPENECCTPNESVFLDLTLNDIPDDNDLCVFCGAKFQKEFLRHEFKTDILIVTAYAFPGYGCTGCGLKHLHVPTFCAVLLETATKFRNIGDNDEARHLEQEVALLKKQGHTV